MIIPDAVYRELADLKIPVPGTLEVKTFHWLEIRQVINIQQVKYFREEVGLDFCSLSNIFVLYLDNQHSILCQKWNIN